MSELAQDTIAFDGSGLAMDREAYLSQHESGFLGFGGTTHYSSIGFANTHWNGPAFKIVAAGAIHALGRRAIEAALQEGLATLRRVRGWYKIDGVGMLSKTPPAHMSYRPARHATGRTRTAPISLLLTRRRP